MSHQKFGLVSYEDLSSFPFVEQKISVIPYLFAKQKSILPLQQTEAGFLVAISDPLNVEPLAELRLFLKAPISSVYCSEETLEAAIERCYSQKEEEAKNIFLNAEKKEKESLFEGETESYDLLEQADQNPVIRMVHTLFLEAIQQGASDIHFEPSEEGMAVRYRIDGVLQSRHLPPRDYQLQILTRIKVMAKMDIAEHRLPQDGRIKLRHGGREIDFRVSTLPILHGERIVLRILDKGSVRLNLEHLGLGLDLLQTFRKWISLSEGIILVTGPTGSGKTTTLYSAICEIVPQSMNIMTIEDPVEYKMSHISQMNVNPKIELDFAKGLRHILRQDPDVILIGEIRDKETAEIAIQASLTGHLVLSTLHTNDAPSALTRLADMGIEPYLLASSILGVVGQRLLRCLCPFCKVSYSPSEEELKELGISKKAGVSFFQGQGCLHCFETGYKGRKGIYELMPMTLPLKSQVLKSQDAMELKRIAIQQGMKSLFEEGLKWVLEGETSSRELLRVTQMVQEM